MDIQLQRILANRRRLEAQRQRDELIQLSMAREMDGGHLDLLENTALARYNTRSQRRRVARSINYGHKKMNQKITQRMNYRKMSKEMAIEPPFTNSYGKIIFPGGNEYNRANLRFNKVQSKQLRSKM